MPIRRIFAQASAAIVSVVFAVTIQCPYASGIEFQRTHAVRDDVQVVKTMPLLRLKHFSPTAHDLVPLTMLHHGGGCGRFLGDRTERFSYVQS